MSQAPERLNLWPYHQTNETGRVHLVGEHNSPDQLLIDLLGPVFREYRQAWRASEKFDFRPDWPMHLDVDTNYTCNLRCVMCPLGVSGFPVSYPQRFLDFDLYETVITEGAANGLASIRLGITGEPLLRSDILDFVRLAKEKRIPDIMLITNGMRLEPAMSRALIEAGLTRLMVSIDAATPETYNRIRIGGDLNRVVRHVLDFLKLRREMNTRLPLLRVSFVKMSFNEAEIEEFEKFWADKADYISFQEYANLLERPDTAYFPTRRHQAVSFRCPDPWQRMSLYVNGDLFPCCSDFGRLAPVGNAYDTPVAEVWLGAGTEYFRQIHKNGHWRESSVCRRCALSSTVF